MSEYSEQVQPDRNAWHLSVPQMCMICGVADSTTMHGLQVHEIERRSQAPGRWGHRCNYLIVCQECHTTLGGKFWTHARQLAVKLIRDVRHFDLLAWLRLRDQELKAPDRVTMLEIVSHLVLK